MSKWIETKDGRIIDAHYIDEKGVSGYLIREDEIKLKYGEMVFIDKKEIKEDELLFLR